MKEFNFIHVSCSTREAAELLDGFSPNHPLMIQFPNSGQNATTEAQRAARRASMLAINAARAAARNSLKGKSNMYKINAARHLRDMAATLIEEPKKMESSK